MHQLFRHALALRHSERFQRRSFWAVIGLGIAVWAGALVQINVLQIDVERAHHIAAAETGRAWQLTSICSGEGSLTACINGCWVEIGDRFRSRSLPAEVVGIDGNQVQLAHGGERVVLRIHSRDRLWDMFEDKP